LRTPDKARSSLLSLLLAFPEREEDDSVRRVVLWALALLAAIAAFLSLGPTPLAAACPPTPQCPCV